MMSGAPSAVWLSTGGLAWTLAAAPRKNPRTGRPLSSRPSRDVGLTVAVTTFESPLRRPGAVVTAAAARTWKTFVWNGWKTAAAFEVSVLAACSVTAMARRRAPVVVTVVATVRRNASARLTDADAVTVAAIVRRNDRPLVTAAEVVAAAEKALAIARTRRGAVTTTAGTILLMARVRVGAEVTAPAIRLPTLTLRVAVVATLAITASNRTLVVWTLAAVVTATKMRFATERTMAGAEMTEAVKDLLTARTNEGASATTPLTVLPTSNDRLTVDATVATTVTSRTLTVCTVGAVVTVVLMTRNRASARAADPAVVTFEVKVLAIRRRSPGAVSTPAAACLPTCIVRLAVVATDAATTRSRTLTVCVVDEVMTAAATDFSTCLTEDGLVTAVAAICFRVDRTTAGVVAVVAMIVRASVAGRLAVAVVVTVAVNVRSRAVGRPTVGLVVTAVGRLRPTERISPGLVVAAAASERNSVSRRLIVTVVAAVALTCLPISR